MALTRNQILAADDLATKTVEIPEWGGEVRIAAMSARRHAQFEQLAEGAGELDSLAYYAVSILVDEHGEPLFDGIDDIKALGGKSSQALMRILNAGLELNGVTEADIKATAKKSTPANSPATATD